MCSSIRTRNFSGFLFSASSLAIGLLMLVSNPEALAGKRLEPGETHFEVVDATKIPAPTGSHEDAEIGINEWSVQERIIFVSGEINSELAETVIFQMLYLDHKSPGKDIYL